MEKRATAANVTELLGKTDPITMTRLLATGASTAEIAEAVDEERMPSSPRVAQVRAILEQHAFEDLEDEFDAHYDHT